MILKDQPTRAEEVAALGLGCFDGLHLGHAQLLAKLGPGGALLIIDKWATPKLATPQDLARLSGLEIFECDFSQVRGMSGADFLAALKNEFVNLKRLVVGEDFAFGRNRSHTAADLAGLSGLEVIIVEEFSLDGTPVHTSLIKELLARGELGRAGRLLGRAYSLRGRVVAGQGLGRTALVPTINISCPGRYLPREGVYASWTVLLKNTPHSEDCAATDKKVAPQGRGVQGGRSPSLPYLSSSFLKNEEAVAPLPSASFIGTRSSDKKFSIETHILEGEVGEVGEGVELEIFFVEYLRANKSFTGLAPLKEQIEADLARARELLGSRAASECRGSPAFFQKRRK